MTDGPARKELKATLDDYIYASEIWDTLLKIVRDRQWYLQGYGSDGKTIYSGDYFRMYETIALRYPNVERRVQSSGPGVFNRDDVLNGIWQAARKHAEKAASLLPKE